MMGFSFLTHGLAVVWRKDVGERGRWMGDGAGEVQPGTGCEPEPQAPTQGGVLGRQGQSWGPSNWSTQGLLTELKTVRVSTRILLPLPVPLKKLRVCFIPTSVFLSTLASCCSEDPSTFPTLPTCGDLGAFGSAVPPASGPLLLPQAVRGQRAAFG